MKRFLSMFVAFLFTCGPAIALAAVAEGGPMAPEPQVNVVWVYVFLIVFVGICAWFGFAIWNSDRKSKDGAKSGSDTES
jgi:hypothetical protein